MAKSTESFSQGIQHTKRLMFQPFRFVFWIKLTFLLYLTYGLSSLFQLATNTLMLTDLRDQSKWVEYIPVFIGLLVVFLLFKLFSLFLASVVRFLFYDAVWNGFSQYLEPFTRTISRIISYFLWNIGFGIVVGILLLILGILLLGLAWVRPVS